MENRPAPVHRRAFEILKAAGQEFGNDMGSRFGAALSFYTIFSLVPLLFLIVAVVGFVSSDSQLTPSEAEVAEAEENDRDACRDVGVDDIDADPRPANPLDRSLLQVRNVAGEPVADQLAQLTCQSSANRQQALWIGLALAAFSGSSVFLHVQGVLNFIFGTPDRRTRGLVNAAVQRGIAVGWALLLAILVFAPLVAVGAVNVLTDLVPADVEWLSTVLGFAVPLTSLVLLVVVVGLTFQLLTRIHVPWRAARRGGLFTAVVGLLGAFGVGFYLERFGGGGALGAIGGVVILLFFFNLMWIIYLFGAEVTKVYTDYLAHGDIRAPHLRPEGPPEHPPLSPPRSDSGARLGILGFAAGVVAGWLARRKD